MKTLLILRHAKSSWKDETRSDHDRPLNDRGKREAPLVGEWLAAADLVPDHIVCSTARRARKTAQKVAKACHYDGPIELCDELYLSGPTAYIGVLNALPPDRQRVLIVGHNPDVESLLTGLTGTIVAFGTAHIAHVTLPIDAWRDLRLDESGTFVCMWEP